MIDPVASPGRVRRSPRLRRLIAKDPVELSKATGPGPIALSLAATWLGLITGPLELGLLLGLKPLSDPTPGLFHMNRHVVWMIPVFHLAFFGSCGLLLALTAKVRSGLSPKRAAFLLGFLAVVSLLLALRQLHVAAATILACGLAYRAAPIVERCLLRSERFVHFSLPWLGCAGLMLFGGTYGRETWEESRAVRQRPPVPASAPNVLLIVLDTVRADHLGLYGYHRETTPNLSRLAKRGVRFDQARSTAPWTLPSHASMFTGCWPHQLSAGFHGPLDGRAPTVAEWFGRHGYATAGFVANTLYCGAETGLNRGFAHYEDHEVSFSGILHSAAIGQRILSKGVARVGRVLGSAMPGAEVPHARPASARVDRVPHKPYKDAERINRDFLAWLDGQGERPFFAFLNYFDAHTPYLLPEGFDRHFGLVPASRSEYAMLDGFWGADKAKLSSHDVALARDAYDDCIASLDLELGKLFEALDRTGRLRDTVVVITADHGEEFGEHHLFGHASSLYGPEVHVPLVIVAPGRVPSGRTVPEPVSLRDLAVTLAKLPGFRDQPPLPGRSLARHWEERSPAAPVANDLVLSEVDAPATVNANQGRSPVFRGSMKALVAEGKVYIRNGDGVEELYDLENDPNESHDLSHSVDSLPTIQRLRNLFDQSLH